MKTRNPYVAALLVAAVMIPASVSAMRIPLVNHVNVNDQESVCADELEMAELDLALALESRCAYPGETAVDEEAVEDLDPYVVNDMMPSLGGGRTVCVPITNTLCAMAAADSSIQRVNNAPNMAAMLTMGGAQSNTPWEGSAQIETTLGSGSCPFPGNSGCMLMWQNVAEKGACAPTKASTEAVSFIWAVAVTYSDPTCERR